MTPDNPTEWKVVQCQYRLDTPTCRAGARAYLTICANAAGKRARILARSRSGRWVERWESLRVLCNFRIKTLVADDPASRHKQIARNYWTMEAVDNLNRLSDQIADRNRGASPQDGG